MVSIATVDDQLRRTGHRIGIWGRSEVKELCNILLPGEQILDCVNGHYLNGFAMLCATNQRIILVDSKPMFLTVEDIRYDMIAEIDYTHRLLDSTVKIFTPTKSLLFTSWNIARMRRLATNAQQHVLAIRQFQQANSQSFAQNYQIGQFQNIPAQINLAQPIYQPMSRFVENENITMASIAVDHAMTSDSSHDIKNLDALPIGNNGTSYPVNPFIKSSFKSRNRSWPKNGVIPKH